MALTLNVFNNISALNTRRHMKYNNQDLGRRLERLSSGLRINGAADDASGLAISERFRAHLSGLTMGVRNAETGANMVQVAEGSLNEVSAMLIRLRELAIQASSSTMNNLNRESIEAEVNQIKREIDRIAVSTVYNDQTLLTGFGNQVDGAHSTALTASHTTGVVDVKISGALAGMYVFQDSASDNQITLGNDVVAQTIRIGTLLDQGMVATGTTAVLSFDRLGIQVTLAGHGIPKATGRYADGDLHGATLEITPGIGGSFQVGADDAAANRVEMTLGDMRAGGSTLGLNAISLSTQSAARAALARIELASDAVADQRGALGTTMNRLRHTVNFTENSIENNTRSEAVLRDADMAVEVTRFTRAQILGQAATAMLAQANVKPQAALSLLQ